MTIKEIYELAIKMGIEADLRGKKAVEENLERIKKSYEKLSKEEKEEFDSERLKNPYSDTRILYGNPDKKVKRIIAGIDADAGELMIAKHLSVHAENPIDLFISHHPTGQALAGLDEVMHMQAEVLALYGVPINVAQSLLKTRIGEVARGVAPINHNKAVFAAKNLDLPLMCVHTPADNLVADYLKKLIEKAKPKIVGELVDLLKKIPEYKEAAKDKAGVRLFAGDKENYAGKIAITEITGGTEGSPKIYEKMAIAGIGTVVSMHLSEEHKKEADSAHINVVAAGHISSDSIGFNLFLDELEKRGIEIIPASGLIRIKRREK